MAGADVGDDGRGGQVVLGGLDDFGHVAAQQAQAVFRAVFQQPLAHAAQFAGKFLGLRDGRERGLGQRVGILLRLGGQFALQAIEFRALRHVQGLGALERLAQRREVRRLALEPARAGPQIEVRAAEAENGQEGGGGDGGLADAVGLGQFGNLEGIAALGAFDDEAGAALVDFEVVAAFGAIEIDQRHGCLLSAQDSLHSPI